ncbi:hypothetical protein CTRI78_v008585 [Colletotrichum trifolii]|uniref:Uncharacterized protein n=1 Tax=Colletotrichum trifolii TaxID=5466 RepID=A0A4R8QTT9_COLTR|nr:hypothetical protein CTRI78_v008585 [Colletotrichum trifolii]
MTPTVISPASPVELLHYMITYQRYPTTLLICSSDDEFRAAIAEELKGQIPEEQLQQEPDEFGEVIIDHPLAALPIFRRVVARHLRVLFVPSVIHLRAILSVFSQADSPIPPPPEEDSENTKQGARPRPPSLFAYGFLELHRDSSEWSAQGLSSSASMFVAAARRSGFNPVMVEPKVAGGHANFKHVLREHAPILSGGARRDEGWQGRTVEVRRVLDRWFRFQTGQWDIKWPEDNAS